MVGDLAAKTLKKDVLYLWKCPYLFWARASLRNCQSLLHWSFMLTSCRMKLIMGKYLKFRPNICLSIHPGISPPSACRSWYLRHSSSVRRSTGKRDWRKLGLAFNCFRFELLFEMNRYSSLEEHDWEEFVKKLLSLYPFVTLSCRLFWWKLLWVGSASVRIWVDCTLKIGYATNIHWGTQDR